MSDAQVLSLPPSTNLICEPFEFSSFRSDTYMKFIAAFEELNKAFEQMHFWKCFLAFDPRGLADNISKIAGCRNGKLEILVIHYRRTKEDTFMGITNTQNPDVDEDKTRFEQQGFKHFMHLKHHAHHCKIDIGMQSHEEDEKEKKALKGQKHFGLQDLLKEIKIDDTLSSVYPNCYKPFYYLLLFPLSTACIGRLFSKMKLIKTRLRNNLSQSTLENLLFIATEAQEDFHDDHYKHFVNDLKRLNPNVRIKW